MENRKEVNLLIIASTNNALKCSKGKAESPQHRQTKFELSAFCWERGIDFATEVTFKDNQRADFVIKDWVVAIEVLNSEKLKDFWKKKYPIPAIPIFASIEPKKLTEIMEDLETTDGSGAGYYIRESLIKLKGEKQ